MLNYLPLYIANVEKTGLGDSGRAISVSNDFMPEAGDVFPLLDGIVKLPPPEKGDQVLILQLDATNLRRWYMPIRTNFNNDDHENIQLGDATDFVVLASLLVSIFNQHIHSTPVGPSGPPSTPIQEAQIAATKVKAE